jgi:myo-inositol-1(or 4)-monophosphatase
MNERFVAEKGSGAFLNDRRLRVAARTELHDCVIATGVPHLGRKGHGEFLLELRRMMASVVGVRRCGAASIDLAWTAAGRFDGFWEQGLLPWDMAAGTVIVREAGGAVSDLSGGSATFDTGTIVAGNLAIHERLIETLARARAEA